MRLTPYDNQLIMSESSVKTVHRNIKSKNSDSTQSSQQHDSKKQLINGNHDSENSNQVETKKDRTRERAFEQLQNHPFNKKCVHSLLSSQSDIQNYRGFLNVAGIILVCILFSLFLTSFWYFNDIFFFF